MEIVKQGEDVVSMTYYDYAKNMKVCKNEITGETLFYNKITSQPYTGTYSHSRDFFEQSDVIVYEEIVEGRRSGVQKTYNGNELQKVALYKDGMLHGKTILYNNGKKYGVLRYKLGVLKGGERKRKYL